MELRLRSVSSRDFELAKPGQNHSYIHDGATQLTCSKKPPYYLCSRCVAFVGKLAYTDTSEKRQHSAKYWGSKPNADALELLDENIHIQIHSEYEQMKMFMPLGRSMYVEGYYALLKSNGEIIQQPFQVTKMSPVGSSVGDLDLDPLSTEVQHSNARVADLLLRVARLEADLTRWNERLAYLEELQSQQLASVLQLVARLDDLAVDRRDEVSGFVDSLLRQVSSLDEHKGQDRLQDASAPVAGSVLAYDPEYYCD